jgi:hypothetical protein
MCVRRSSLTFRDSYDDDGDADDEDIHERNALLTRVPRE